VADDEPEKIHQCKTCPWRVDCEPMTDIPNYVPGLHHKLDNTIAEPGSLAGLSCTTMRVMACHYSKPGEEFPCAGWLHHQIGPGNNIAVRMRVMFGKMPVPVVDGEQHETFEDTLCNVPTPASTRAPKRSRPPQRRAPKKRR
jgi:hypothetical protein